MARFSVKAHLEQKAAELCSEARKKKWVHHESEDSMVKHLTELRKALLKGYFWGREGRLTASYKEVVFSYGPDTYPIWDEAVLIGLMCLRKGGLSPRGGQNHIQRAHDLLVQALCPDKEGKLPPYRELF